MTTTVAGDLEVADCWRLLLASHRGRLATVVGDWIELIPIDYLVHEASILFRTGAATASEPWRPVVAFEIDGEDARWHWSVQVHGTIEPFAEDEMTSGMRRLKSWCPSGEFDVVRLTPELLSGHRVDRHEFHRASVIG
jgi:uncharacterized protein